MQAGSRNFLQFRLGGALLQGIVLVVPSGVHGAPQRVAYSWVAPAEDHENIIPVYHASYSQGLNSENAWEFLEKQPEGHRAILFRELGGETIPHLHSGDQCLDPGTQTMHPGIWWTAGADSARALVTGFVNEMDALGASVDVLAGWQPSQVLDNFAVGSCGADTASAQRWRAIQGDPRFEANIRDSLGFEEDLEETVCHWTDPTRNYLA